MRPVATLRDHPQYSQLLKQYGEKECEGGAARANKGKHRGDGKSEKREGEGEREREASVNNSFDQNNNNKIQNEEEGKIYLAKNIQ